MKPTKLVDTDEYVHTLYYGDYGTAKTTNAAYVANKGPVLFINAEGGLKRRALERVAEVTGMPLAIDNISIVKPEAFEATLCDGVGFIVG